MFKSAVRNAGQIPHNQVGNKSLEIVVNFKELGTKLDNKDGVKEGIRNKIWRMPAHSGRIT
jgi:hypothetical protein